MEELKKNPRMFEAIRLLHTNGFALIEIIRLCNSGLSRFHINEILKQEVKND